MSIDGQKRVRHYDEPGVAHSLTFTCYHRLPLLADDEVRMLMIRSLDATRRRLRFSIWAYVLMPNHVHLLIRPNAESYSIAQVLQSIKQPVAFHGLKRARILYPDLGHFWQRGPGFDENISTVLRAREMASYIHANPVRKGLVSTPEDWRWSSARFWMGQLEFDLAMDAIE